MEENNKIKLNDTIWANLEYQLANHLLKEAFVNPNLNHKIENSPNLKKQEKTIKYLNIKK